MKKIPHAIEPSGFVVLAGPDGVVRARLTNQDGIGSGDDAIAESYRTGGLNGQLFGLTDSISWPN
jgi:hypothetical protein